MNSLEEYLDRTESAVIKLFDAIDSYIAILRNSPKPSFISGGNVTDFETNRNKREKSYDAWKAKNREIINLSLEVQRDFIADSFALSTLCGSVLQIASMGIQWFSENEDIPEDLPEELKPLLEDSKSQIIKFCIGRRIRKMPFGLIIYAGRNQYNHMNHEKLSKLNTTIFCLIANNWKEALEHYDELEEWEYLSECKHAFENSFEKSFQDPAFDLGNTASINLSSNITNLLGWNNYESYCADMHSLIGK